MNNSISYSQYKEKLYELINLIVNYPEVDLSFSIQNIHQILKIKGISALGLLLDEDLIEHLNERFFDYENIILDLYRDIYKTLYFKGIISKKMREEYLPNLYCLEEERNPTKREILYDQILSLKYEYDSIDYDKNKNFFFNIFPQKLNEIKNFYSKMIAQGSDEKNHKYDQFDKDFFNELIGYLDEILNEIINKKQQNEKEILRKKQIKNNLDMVKGIPLQKRTFFYIKEKLIYGEDMQIEYKNYSFPFTDKHKEQFKKQICAFLNSKGGRIFIGVTDDKVVNGILLNYHEKDKNTNEIVNLTYDFYPKCRTYVDVSFIPIKNKDNKYIKNLYVIKIIISQGETNQLYSYTSKGFMSYLRLKGQCIFLSAEEIKKELLRRDKYPEKQINPNEFKDPEPDNPELVIANKALEKQFKSMNLNDKNISSFGYNKQQLNSNYNNINYENDDEDYEFDELMDEEENEDFEEWENEENNEIRGRGNLSLGYRGLRGNMMGKRGGYNGGKRYNSNKIFPVKIKISSLTGINPSIQELNIIFGSLKCRKKFINKGKKVFGFLNFNTKEEAIFFINNFNYNVCPNYEFRLIPKFENFE